MRSICFVFAIIALTLALTAVGDAPAGIVVSSESVPALVSPAGNAEVRMLLGAAQTGNSQIYVGRIQFQPGGNVPEHVHEKSEEVVYVLHGSGKFVMAGKEYSVKPGDVVYIPRNTPHSFSNNGSEVVEAVQIYTPAGPEQRFLDWKPK